MGRHQLRHRHHHRWFCPTGTGDVNLANSTLNIKGAGLAKTTASGKDVTVTVSEKAVKQEAVKAVTMAAADPNGAITVTPELSADKDTATYKVGIDQMCIRDSGYLEDIDLVLAATADQDIDMWLHAGDFGDDARYMQEHTDIPVYAVRGNNDRLQPLEPREQLIPLEDTYIYMTHGHEVSYYNRIQKLIEIGRAHV